MTLARQWHEDSPAAISNTEPSTVAPKQTIHPAYRLQNYLKYLQIICELVRQNSSTTSETKDAFHLVTISEISGQKLVGEAADEDGMNIQILNAQKLVLLLHIECS